VADESLVFAILDRVPSPSTPCNVSLTFHHSANVIRRKNLKHASFLARRFFLSLNVSGQLNAAFWIKEVVSLNQDERFILDTSQVIFRAASRAAFLSIRLRYRRKQAMIDGDNFTIRIKEGIGTFVCL